MNLKFFSRKYMHIRVINSVYNREVFLFDFETQLIFIEIKIDLYFYFYYSLEDLYIGSCLNI